MDSRTGEIGFLKPGATKAEIEEFCKKYDTPLSQEHYMEVKPLNRAQRRSWAKKHKKTKQR